MSNFRPACASFAGPDKRDRVDRFASVLADERARQEEQDALRVAMLSTSKLDRSAVQAVADAFVREPATVYNWIEGRTELNPLREFCRLLDACIAGKGRESAAALEPARLIRRRYLDPQPDDRETTPALVTSTAAETMAVVGSLLADLLHAVDPASVGGPGLTTDEWRALEPQIERATALLESLRLMGPAALRGNRQVPIRGGVQ